MSRKYPAHIGWRYLVGAADEQFKCFCTILSQLDVVYTTVKINKPFPITAMKIPGM